MRSSISIDIDAPARLVFDLARRVECWPQLLPHYLDVRAEQREPGGALTARMVAVRAVVPGLGYGLPVAWRARTWSELDALRLRFVHLGGATAGMDVTWRIEPTGAGCRVTIEHAFEPAVPGWATFLDRFFVRPIAGRTLSTFKAIAETVATSTASASPSPPASEKRQRTKTSS